MSDGPITFSTPMVCALLSGVKTQTRRIIDVVTETDLDAILSENQESLELENRLWPTSAGRCVILGRAPRYAVGDRFWVRETWAVGNIYDGCTAREINPGGKPNWCGIRYAATDVRLGIMDRAAIHMPRWASRLTLTVTDVRVQRLQDISEEDALAEGVDEFACSKDRPGSWNGLSQADRIGMVQVLYGSARQAYRHFWDTVHSPGAWDKNSWVAAVSFAVNRANIDALSRVEVA